MTEQQLAIERQSILSDLRALLAGQAVTHGPRLARYTQAYMRSYLIASSHHWRHGIRDETADTADGAANMAAGIMLAQPSEPSAECFPNLHKWLSSALKDHNDYNDSEVPNDETLLLAFHRLLRGQARQALRRMWQAENPEMARLLRLTKSRIAEQDHIHLTKDARGQFVTSAESTLRHLPIAKDLLATLCHDTRFLLELEGFEKTLRHILVPGPGHGGYCYLMDLVRVIHEGRIALHRLSIDASVQNPIARDGLPMKLWAAKQRAHLRKRTEEIIRRQEEKWVARQMRNQGHCPSSSPDVLAARAEIAVEMAGRKVGLGRSEWEGISQRELLRRLCPGIRSEDEHRRLNTQIDHVVRCLAVELHRLSSHDQTQDTAGV